MVTIRSYGHPVQAHADRALLEEHGIPAFVADEHTAGVLGLAGSALGEVRLQVRASDAELAERTLVSVMGDPQPPPAPTSRLPLILLFAALAVGSVTVILLDAWR